MKRKSMYRNIGGKRIHVNQLAAHSRQFTVSNNTIPKVGLNEKNIVTMFKEIRTTKFDTPVLGKMFEIDKDGHYHLIEREFDPTPLLQNHKQPKRLTKYKKRKHTGEKWSTNGQTVMHNGVEYPCYMRIYDIKRQKRNDFTSFKNYPYNITKMSKEKYWEKLTEHKLARWERKNPCPIKDDNTTPDLFAAEHLGPWRATRDKMKEHFRDVVVSMYDKLAIVGNYVDRKNKKVKKKVVATIKDIDGKGHNVNHPDLSINHKLYKNAVGAAKVAMRADHSIIDCDLMNHKRNQVRPLLITKSELKKAA